MKYVIGCALMLVLGFYGCGQRADECKKFKNGSFKILDKKLGVFNIIRTDNWQMEYREGGKDTLTFAVQWVDDCTYKLKPYSSYFKKYPDAPKNSELTISINKTTANSYFATVASNFDGHTVDCEIIKVK